MKKQVEIFLLKIALKILDRNVERCKIISRRDNNYLFSVHSELKQIIERIEDNYETHFLKDRYQFDEFKNR